MIFANALIYVRVLADYHYMMIIFPNKMRALCMNIYTKQIAALFGIPMTLALHIQDLMQIDFSECTTQEFIREARLVYSLIDEV